MTCVVCRAALAGEPHFANAWEKVRKLYPCCSAGCAARFDPDTHWFPAARPELTDGQEEARLLHDARRRIREGDRPSLVVRDMLIAGVGIGGVRKLLIEGELTASAEERAATRISIFGFIGAFAGLFHTAERRSKQDIGQLRAANADIEAWEAHFRLGGASRTTNLA